MCAVQCKTGTVCLGSTKILLFIVKNIKCFVKIKPELFGAFICLYNSHISLQQSVNYLENLVLYQTL